MDQKFNQLEKYLSDFTNRISCQEEMIRVLWGELAVQSKTMKKLEIKRQDKMKTIELLNTRECIVNNLKTKIERQDELIKELQKRRDEEAQLIKEDMLVDELNVKLDAQKYIIERLENKVDEQSDLLLYLQSQEKCTSKEAFEMTFEKFMNTKGSSFALQVEFCPTDTQVKCLINYGGHVDQEFFDIEKDAVSGRYDLYTRKNQTDKEIVKILGLKNLQISGPKNLKYTSVGSFWLKQFIQENRNHVETLSVDYFACEGITFSNLKVLSLGATTETRNGLGVSWCPKIEKLEVKSIATDMSNAVTFVSSFIQKHGHLIRHFTMPINWLKHDSHRLNFSMLINLTKLVIVGDTTVNPTTHQNDHNILFFKFDGHHKFQYKRNELVNLPDEIEIQISGEEIRGKYPVVVHGPNGHFNLGYQIQCSFNVTKDLEAKLKVINGLKIHRRNRNIYLLQNND